MEAVLTKPKQSYVFDRKLTPEEIQELVDNYDYDPSVYDNDDYSGDATILFDKYGNPTEDMIRSKYEIENGYTEGPFTLEEFFDELDELRAEVDLS